MEPNSERQQTRHRVVTWAAPPHHFDPMPLAPEHQRSITAASPRANRIDIARRSDMSGDGEYADASNRPKADQVQSLTDKS
jgi:hypothetical protein